MNAALAARRSLSTLSLPPRAFTRSLQPRFKSTHHPTSQPTNPTAPNSPSAGQAQLRAGAALKPRLPLAPPPHLVAAGPSSAQPAQPPPSPHGPPRLVRFPSPDYSYTYGSSTFSSTDGNSSITYTKAPVSRLFGFHNAATATSASSSTRTRTSIGSPAFAPRSQTLDTMSSSTAGHVALPSSSATAASTTAQTANGGLRQRKAGEHDHDHDHDHDHGHSHGWFGHSHSHAHGAEGSAEEADRLLAALKGKGDRGSNITVVGLIANLALCGAKGVAGVWLHSASLLADAAHSLSDTFSDIVTLFCWKMSQRPASLSHPLGYGKFETMGGLGVSVVLVVGALAIGLHSYGLLLEVLQPALQNAPKSIQAIGSLTGHWASAAGAHLHEHHHAVSSAVPPDAASAVLGAAEAAASSSSQASAATALDAHGQGENLLDPNAMWFALISILVKEWLYRATLKIAKEENSSVLEANAIHHRSDSLSSGVTFLAIGGSYLGFPVLDPLGGLLVAGLIGKQGFDLLLGALADLSDRGVEPSVLSDFESAIRRVQDELQGQSAGEGIALLDFKNLRAVRSGVSSFVDVTLVLAPEVQLASARKVEVKVRQAIEAAHKGVKEVRIHLDTPA